MKVVDIAQNFREVSERVRRAAERADRNPDNVVIIGAAKTVEPDRIQEAIDAGLRHLGENYVQEGVAKMAALPPALTWHFIGHLQTNKVRQIVGARGDRATFEFVHSLDRAPLLAELEKRSGAAGVAVQVLVEVNLAGESTKTGALLSAAYEIVECGKSCSHARIVGLMTMPPPLPPEEARPYFRQLRELRDELQSHFGFALPHLSMGMTSDYEVAIEEGATMVRIGTGIFGPRS